MTVLLDRTSTARSVVPAVGRPALAVGLAVALLIAMAVLVPAATEYPSEWRLPLARLLTVWMKGWIPEVAPVTRALASVGEVPLVLVTGLLAKGFELSIGGETVVLPPLSWVGLSVAACWIAFRLGGMRLFLVQAAACAYLVAFGQWPAAMLTLASVIVCVPIAISIGLLVGILAHLRPGADRWLMSPALDLMQTMPAFAYLVPTLLLFGFGPVAAMIATVVFALPPMARATKLALDQAPVEFRELAQMIGCSGPQTLFRILLPSAKPLLLVGFNQTVMMTLNMVIIGSMIGAGGLGFDVLLALRQLDIGKGVEAGMAIVVLAIVLDRQGVALANLARSGGRAARRMRIGWLTAAAVLLLSSVLSFWFDWLREFPEALRLSTGTAFNEFVGWVNVHYFDVLEGIRVFLMTHLMNPIKRLLVDSPWSLVAGAATLIVYLAGGLRLALLSVLVLGFCLVTGLWEKSMITIYLCLSATIVAVVIGIPLAMFMARFDPLYKALNVTVELLQTLPSFVYLIPVVMLFRVGDFTALLAILAFAITPILKFTAAAMRSVPVELIEAGRSMGCTPRQIDRYVRVPMSLGAILLGINQAILFALAMVVITALVGTRDLGQEVYIALTSANPGRGLVAGLCLALLGILIDRTFQASVAKLQRRSGAPAEA